MAVFQTYQASAGNREDLIDVITNIAHEETPLLSTFKRSKARSTKHDWMQDALEGGTAINKIVEGAATTYGTLVARTRVYNYTQIMERSYEVSETQEWVDVAGVSSEMSYQAAKAMKNLALDIEYALVNGSSAAGASATAREMNGVLAFIATNVNSATASRALTNTIYNDALQTTYGNSKVRVSDIYCGGFQKRTISGFTTPNTRYVDSGEKKFTTAIDVYDGDFGRQKIHLHYIMGTSNADKLIGIDPAYWKTAWGKPPKAEKMPKVGDSHRGRVSCEVTLEALHEKTGLKILNLTTS